MNRVVGKGINNCSDLSTYLCKVPYILLLTVIGKGKIIHSVSIMDKIILYFLGYKMEFFFQKQSQKSRSI